MKRLRGKDTANDKIQTQEDNTELALVPDLIRLILLDHVAPLWLEHIRQATKPEIMRARIRRYRDLFLRDYSWVLLTEKERVVHQTRLLSAAFSVTMMSMLIDPLLRMNAAEKACLRQWATTIDLGMPLSGSKPTTAFPDGNFWTTVGQALEQYLPRVARYILICDCWHSSKPNARRFDDNGISTPTWCNRGGKVIRPFVPVPKTLETPALAFVDFSCYVFEHLALCRTFIEPFHQPDKLSFLIFQRWLLEPTILKTQYVMDFSQPSL